MSKMSRIAAGSAVVALLGVTVVNTLTIREQQSTIDSLVQMSALSLELETMQETKLWDLHDRVRKLENEDKRIMAHVRWFVQRRSGTAELRKMEQAIKNLERAD